MARRTPLRRSRRWTVTAVLGASVALASAIFAVANATTPSHTPYGRFDAVSQTSTGFAVRGWAIDPDTSAPIHVDIYVDGRALARVVAANPRPDVAQVHPGYGANHGYSVAFSYPAGAHTMCVYAINSGAGTTNPLLGCRTLTINFDPTGSIAATAQFPGGLIAAGWAADINAPQTPLSVQLIVDGQRTGSIVANQARGDVAMAGAGPNHGFTIITAAAEGTHQVCLAITNVGLGSDAVVSCRAVTLNFSPVGAITSLFQIPGGFRVIGWTSDPDTSATEPIAVKSGGIVLATGTANFPNASAPGHGFDVSVMLPNTPQPPGVRHVCVQSANLGSYGETRDVACQNITLNFNPTAGLVSIGQASPGARIVGWAVDPDTSDPVTVGIVADGNLVAGVTANQAGGPHPGHLLTALIPLPNGTHTICVVAANLSYGTGNSDPACSTVTLNFNPYGRVEAATRVPNSTAVTVRGWAGDPDTASAITVNITLDGAPVAATHTGITRADVAAALPGVPANTGFSATYPASDGEHTLCATGVNAAGGTGDTALGCAIVNAVHPVPPSAPQNVVAVAGYGGATVTWTAPASDGGAPWTSYLVTASQGGPSVQVPAWATSATVMGLQPSSLHSFSVVARNVAGTSSAGTSAIVRTEAAPPPQTTPAPVSTSRYIRNVSAATPTDLNTMRAEGAADATANPTGHGYLVLLDIGGQDQADGGVVLSATTHFVAYGDLVNDVNAYVDGYASAQKPSAPVIIAIGTNNDMDVSTTSGVTWARSVVGPVVAHSHGYTGITIAGANDIEPGFRGTYDQTKAWLQGYLASTSAPFVNNGSADGCSPVQTNMGCNNGWTMSGLYYLGGGAAPVRIVDVPQIYNTTMAQQWKFISLTGIGQQSPRIDFGGALTEWTACAQSGSCGSLTGHDAWTQMWSQLQSTSALKVSSLPYSTDLRIDR